MICLSLFISLLLVSATVLADVQINTRGSIYIPPCTINNGQSTVIDSGNINPEHVDNLRGEIIKIMDISCPYKSDSLWVKVTGNTMKGGQNNILAISITHFGTALYQGEGMPTLLTLGNGSGNGYKVTAGLDTARLMFTFTSVPFHNGGGVLNGGDFWIVASMSMIYN